MSNNKRMNIVAFFVLCFVWMGIGMNEVAADEKHYEYQEIAGGVEITNYTGRTGAISIPATLGGKPVVRIGSTAFYNRHLTSVEFPDSVTEIGHSAFDQNELTSVTLPINVVQIERYAFSSNRLKKIELGPHVSHFEATALAYNPIEEIRVDAGNSTYRDIDGKGLYTADGTLLVAGTASGEIANSVTEINVHAFSGRGVQSVIIPDLVTKIGESAFAENQLTHLEIPASVTQIDNRAFENNNLSSVMIGEHVTDIGHGVFQYNQLTHIEIPDNVQTIGNFVFADNRLTQVTIGASMNEFSGSAFLRNPLEKIELAAGNSNLQLAVNGQALYSSDGLKLIIGTVSGEIQDGTTEIGRYAFAGRGLAEITIPASVNTIQGYAFAHNELTNVDIPDGVEEIVNEAFRNNQIKVLKIGKSVQDFTVDAFADNPLAEIKVDGNNSKYKGIDGKGMYTKDGDTLVLGTISGVIEEGTTKIGDYAFRGRGLEGDLTIPSSVTEIDFAAFSTNKLKRVTIPARVNTIGASAFNGNHDLVIFGVKGTKAEAYANEERIPFLSADDPLAVRFEPDGRAGQWQKQAVTKVTVYSFEEFETEQYYIWTDDVAPPLFDETSWTSFASGQELSQTDAGEWYLHIHAKDFADNTIDYSSRLFRVGGEPPISDTTPPIIIFAPNGNNEPAKEVATTVTVSDEGSGVDEGSLQYIWSKSETTPSTGEDWRDFTNGQEMKKSKAEGEWYLYIQAADNAGNSIIARSDVFQLHNRPSGGGSGSWTPSDDVSLKKFELIFGDGSSLTLDPNQLEHRLETEADTIEFIIEPSYEKTLVKVNNEETKGNFKLTLDEGENTITIVIIAENESEQIYTITLNHLKEVPFLDIQEHWAEKYIKEAYRSGWFKGYPDGKFHPKNHLTRMQATSLFVRILELTESAEVPFTDIRSIEEETIEELKKAYANGVINGFSDQTFKPYTDVSRAQLALMIYRSFEKVTGTPYKPKQLADFPDIVGYDEETQNAIAMLVELGIAEGSEGKFMPSNRATRAHAAKMLVNYQDILDNQK